MESLLIKDMIKKTSLEEVSYQVGCQSEMLKEWLENGDPAMEVIIQKFLRNNQDIPIEDFEYQIKSYDIIKKIISDNEDNKTLTFLQIAADSGVEHTVNQIKRIPGIYYIDNYDLGHFKELLVNPSVISILVKSSMYLNKEAFNEIVAKPLSKAVFIIGVDLDVPEDVESFLIPGFDNSDGMIMLEEVFPDVPMEVLESLSLMCGTFEITKEIIVKAGRVFKRNIPTVENCNLIYEKIHELMIFGDYEID